MRQEHYLDELLSAQQHLGESREEYLEDLISRVLSHYQQYYEEKSRMSQINIFLVFSPPWFTSLERAFLWVAGFKPALVFKLVSVFVTDLSEDQKQRMSRLIEGTKVEERALDDKLAKIQESVAAPALLEKARERGRRLGTEETMREEEEAAFNTLRSSMESVVRSADLLRTETILNVVAILIPAQRVKLLAAAMQLHIKVRTRGLQIDAEKHE